MPTREGLQTPQLPPMTVLGFDHVQVAMPEREEAAARHFYGRLLGLQEVEKPAETASRGGVWFKCGHQQLHLGVERAFRPARKAHPAFLVEGYAELLQHLRAEGYEVVEDHSLPGVKRSFTFDPFGNRVEVVQSEPAL